MQKKTEKSDRNRKSSGKPSVKKSNKPDSKRSAKTSVRKKSADADGDKEKSPRSDRPMREKSTGSRKPADKGGFGKERRPKREEASTTGYVRKTRPVKSDDAPRERREDGEKRPWSDRPKQEKSYGSRKPVDKGGYDKERRPKREEGSDSGYVRKTRPAKSDDAPRERREDGEKRPWSDRPKQEKSYGSRKPAEKGGYDKERRPKREEDKEASGRKPVLKKSSDRSSFRRTDSDSDRREPRRRLGEQNSEGDGKPWAARTHPGKKPFIKKAGSGSGRGNGEVRLNKFISNSGVCSRREADVLISTGVVKVNGEVVITMGYKVQPNDKVTVDGRELKSEKKVYLLLNKPKDTITTMDDPEGRNTVMDLVKDACRERIYPVGRLDRNTTGLIMFTNDGDLAKKLMHPSHKIIKVYEATLDKNLTKEDMITISQGVTVDEDFVPVDGIAWSDPMKKHMVGIELHSGAYHVVKRLFEQFGYKVIRLDRTMYGPLTKRNLPRGKWRMLTDDELSIFHRL